MNRRAAQVLTIFFGRSIMSTDEHLQKNRRRFSRVDASRAAKLLNSSGASFEGMVADLSLCGMLLAGDYNTQVGDIVELLLYGPGHRLSLIFKYRARVVRVTQDGIALEFIGMEARSYHYLQTIILYFSEDPLGVCLEFPQEFTSRG